jgi:pimeloyl-ACP methyl ester carboxylesterase
VLINCPTFHILTVVAHYKKALIMEIKAKSYFKNPNVDLQFFRNWIKKLEKQNGYEYDKISVNTSLGKTQIYGLNTSNTELDTIFILPGYRTTSLIWDLDCGLQNLAKSFRIIMIETNGQPNLSEGNSPSIKSLDYGHWLNDVFIELNIEQAYTIGASFGGLVCMKFAITNPEKVKAIFLLNAGCLQSFSLSISNLYYNLLPVIVPNEKNVLKFLDKVIFHKPNHKVSKKAEHLLNEYLLFCLTQFSDKNEKPYYMNEQLSQVNSNTYLLQGDKDILFPHHKSIKNAKKNIKNIKEIKIFNNVGHGIEILKPAIKYIEETIIKEQNALQSSRRLTVE